VENDPVRDQWLLIGPPFSTFISTPLNCGARQIAYLDCAVQRGHGFADDDSALIGGGLRRSGRLADSTLTLISRCRHRRWATPDPDDCWEQGAVAFGPVALYLKSASGEGRPL